MRKLFIISDVAKNQWGIGGGYSFLVYAENMIEAYSLCREFLEQHQSDIYEQMVMIYENHELCMPEKSAVIALLEMLE